MSSKLLQPAALYQANLLSDLVPHLVSNSSREISSFTIRCSHLQPPLLRAALECLLLPLGAQTTGQDHTRIEMLESRFRGGHRSGDISMLPMGQPYQKQTNASHFQRLSTGYRMCLKAVPSNPSFTSSSTSTSSRTPPGLTPNLTTSTHIKMRISISLHKWDVQLS